jgi:hypothetical protein
MWLVTTGPPPPEAYGRVTNPERFRVLHRGAEELLSRLESDYEVDRAEGADVDTRLARGVAVERCVRLVPSTGYGASLTVAFSSFPGLFVRYGLYVTEALPHCGCDACDEDPDSIVSELTTQAELLANGRFTEEIRSGDVLAFTFDGQSRCERWPINSAEIVGPVTPVRRAWGPWSARSPRS